jgi:hypothetical protein
MAGEVNNLDIDNIQIKKNDFLKGKKYGVLQKGVLNVSPAVYKLMEDESANSILMKTFDIISVSDETTLAEILQIASQKFGDRDYFVPDGEMMLPTNEDYDLWHDGMPIDSKGLPENMGDCDVLNTGHVDLIVSNHTGEVIKHAKYLTLRKKSVGKYAVQTYLWIENTMSPSKNDKWVPIQICGDLTLREEHIISAHMAAQLVTEKINFLDGDSYLTEE